MDEEMFNPAWKEKSTTRKRRLIVIAVFTSIGFIAALIVNVLLVFDHREVEHVSAEQIALIAATLDTLHEEVAAARAPRHTAGARNGSPTSDTAPAGRAVRSPITRQHAPQTAVDSAVPASDETVPGTQPSGRRTTATVSLPPAGEVTTMRAGMSFANA